MKVDYEKLRHICDDPVCPDPVWKLSTCERGPGQGSQKGVRRCLDNLAETPPEVAQLSVLEYSPIAEILGPRTAISGTTRDITTPTFRRLLD